MALLSTNYSLPYQTEFEDWITKYKTLIQFDKDVCQLIDNNKYWIYLGWIARGEVDNETKPQ